MVVLERLLFFMKHSKFKHLSFEDRSTIQDFLNFGYNFTQISNRISKDRTTVAKEVKKHRFLKSKISSSLKTCPKLSSPPYVCNSCPKKTSCKFIKYIYDASIAHNEYLASLIDTRSNLKISKHQIASINEVVAPLMIHKHHSVNQVYVSHPDILPFSKTTFYKYIDLGILNVRNIDLRRKVRFKVKKERDENIEKPNKSIRINRSYNDFKDYLEFHPNASIVEMDTVIGTSGGKGGKCFLTLLFRNFNFMLIYLLPYKRSIHVTEVFNDLKKALGPVEFQRLFEVILTDNGSEFSDPLSIEIDIDSGQKLTSVFYCEPNCSWQ